jgi:hypothetical protein
MPAVPRTAATHADIGRHIEQPLRGSQRAHTWPNPPTAVAAYRPFDSGERASEPSPSEQRSITVHLRSIPHRNLRNRHHEHLHLVPPKLHHPFTPPAHRSWSLHRHGTTQAGC